MTWMLLVASIISVLSVWHLNRVSLSSNPRVTRAVRFSGVAALVVLGLAAVNQYSSEVAEKKLRRYELNRQVAEKIAERRISILDDYMSIYLHSAIVSNYINYQEALDAVPVQLHPALSWEKNASETLKKNIDSVKRAYRSLQGHAKEVLDLSMRYPGRVPKAVEQWATMTLNIGLKDLPRFINAYHETPDVLRYADATGLATGAALEAVKLAVKGLEQ